MGTQYNEYAVFLKQYRDELSAYLEKEREKRLALLDNDLRRLEAMLKMQQAETMKLRGLETKRVKLQLKLGLPDTKARELLGTIDDMESRRSVEALFAEITDTARRIREQNRQSFELAKVNLKVFNLISRGGEAETRIRFYGPDGGQREVYSGGYAFEEMI